MILNEKPIQTNDSQLKTHKKDNDFQGKTNDFNEKR